MYHHLLFDLRGRKPPTPDSSLFLTTWLDPGSREGDEWKMATCKNEKKKGGDSEGRGAAARDDWNARP